MIPYGHQDISDADIQAVVDVLKSDYLTQGPVVPRFENAIAEYCSAGNAIAVNSATSALHIACLSLGVTKGDLVWTSPVTFVASANCALYCGAQVDFVDIDPRTYNLSVECLSEKLIQADKEGCLPKVVIPVHLCGQPCDMAEIYELSQRYGFKIIEDASHSIGGKYKGEPIGNCKYSDIVVFSFHPVKIITTGEGGIAITNNNRLAKKMRKLRTHGVTRDEEEMTHKPDGPWYYEQVELGFNYRLTDLQAALGLSQLGRLDDFVSKRHVIAQKYDKQLSDLPIVLPWQHPDSYTGLHLYVIRLNLDKINISRREVFEALRAEGIGVNIHYIPVYHQPYYRQYGFKPGYCIEAEQYYASAISLPMYPKLSDSDHNFVCQTLRKILEAK